MLALNPRWPFANPKSSASSRGLERTGQPGYQVRKLVLLFGLTCLAASNDNSFSSLTSSSGPLTGFRVAAVSYSPVWEIGSPPNVFGIAAEDYWTDAAGHAIPWAASKPRQPGDNHHQFTRVILGRVSFSLPMRPAIAGASGILVFLLLGFLAMAYVTRGSKVLKNVDAAR
jgi:hypothetical protein